MKRSVRVALSVVLLLLVVGLAVIYRGIQSWLHAPIDALNDATLYEVSQGAPLNLVLRDLQKRGLLEYPRGLSMWLRITQPGYKLKAGEYELRSGMTPIDIAELLNSGRVVLHSLTVVEGTTFAEFGRTLAANAAVTVSSTGSDARALLRHLNANVPHPEGAFFPDTYRFPKGTSDLEIYSLAYRRMQNELEQAWRERERDLPLANAYEALILASIVEKEAKLATERPLIAGVFVERLRKGMRLETDPTVIYGLGSAYDGNIHKADLQRDTPYNTYRHAGLPPTPICFPGLDSLRAVVHPDVSGALFFVATGNGDGSHHFSKTFAEHHAAVQRYLKSLR